MSKCRVRSCRMPVLSKEDKLRLLTTILESRHADLREQNLNRQGKGHFHVSGMGHEALAAVSIQTEPGDYIVPYYRDRGLVLGRGMTTRQLGLEYFAKRNTGSGGRQMPSHYSNAGWHIWSVPIPNGSQLLPACGMAWRAFPVTPAPMIRNFIGAPKNCRHWRNQTPLSAGKIS